MFFGFHRESCLEAAAYAIARDSIADFLRDREAEPRAADRVRLGAALTHFNEEGRR